MKNFKLVCLMVSLVLLMQTAVFAADVRTDEMVSETIQSETIQPRGRYLQGGGCTITPYTGYVMVSGHTDSFDTSDQLTVKLTILQEVSPGAWKAIWTDSVTEYNVMHTAYVKRRVDVPIGYRYMVEATHTVKHNGVTETCYSEAGQ